MLDFTRRDLENSSLDRWEMFSVSRCRLYVDLSIKKIVARSLRGCGLIYCVQYVATAYGLRGR